jgi:hypothetical protein
MSEVKALLAREPRRVAEADDHGMPSHYAAPLSLAHWYL